MKNIFEVSAVSVKGNDYGNFGLNQGYITKFEFTENGGKGGTPMNAIDIWVKAGSEFRLRLFDPTGSKVYVDGKQVGPEEDGYEKGYISVLGNLISTLKHVILATGVTEETITKTVSKLNSEDITGGLKTLINLVPKNLEDIEVDVFLEYQSSLARGTTKAYLTLPRFGYFICPKVKPVGQWEEKITNGVLEYVDNDGNKHPFTRNKEFMKSTKANQIGVSKTEKPKVEDSEEDAFF